MDEPHLCPTLLLSCVCNSCDGMGCKCIQYFYEFLLAGRPLGAPALLQQMPIKGGPVVRRLQNTPCTIHSPLQSTQAWTFNAHQVGGLIASCSLSCDILVSLYLFYLCHVVISLIGSWSCGFTSLNWSLSWHMYQT